MSKKYNVTYKLWGNVEVEANSIEEAERKLEEDVSDGELFRGVDGGGKIDAGSIEIHEVVEVEEI